MTLADRLSRSLRRFDAPVNGLHDRLNGRFGALWWPLATPEPERPLAKPEHALYAAHMGIAIACIALLPIPRRRVTGLIIVVGLGSWVLFTGAWDRRAAAYVSPPADSDNLRLR